jgi:beta-galactosidase
VGLPAREPLLAPIIDGLVDRLAIDRGPAVPPGVMARQIDARHILYLNLDGLPKTVRPGARSRSILKDREYGDSFELDPYEPDFIERD